MIIKKAELETVCGITSSFPKHIEPEYAFAGKSNVGKSSLINAVMQRKSLARTSAVPGKTQTINFYHVNDEFFLVDLPGYGFTKVSEKTKESWGRMVERYLKASDTLKNVYLLVDIRHKPSEDDILMFEWIKRNGFEPLIVATKADKLGKNDKVKALKLIRETFGFDSSYTLIPFSSETKEGLELIYETMNTEQKLM